MSHSNVPKVETVPEEGTLGSSPSGTQVSNLEALLRTLGETEEAGMPGDAFLPGGSPSDGSGVASLCGFHVVGRGEAGEHKSPTSGSGSGKLTLVSADWMSTKCLGKIGASGERICTKDKDLCPTKSHQTNKTDELVQEHLHVPGSGTSIFVTPAVSSKALSRLDGADCQALMEEVHSTEEWIRIFNQIMSSKEHHDVVAPPTPKSDGSIGFGFGNEPSPLRVNTTFGEDDRKEVQATLRDSPSGKRTDFESISDPKIRAILHEQHSKLVQAETNVRHLSKSFQIQGVLLNDLQGEIESLADQRQAQPSMEDMVRPLLGDCPIGFTGKTVWESIAEAHRRVSPVSDSSGIEALAAAANKLFGRVKILEDRSRISLPPQVIHHSGSNDGLKSELDHLTARLAAMEERERQANLIHPETFSKLEALERGHLELRKQIVGNSVFKFNGMFFGSEQDVLRHLGESLESSSIGWFIDACGALSQIGEVFYEGGDYASVLHASARVHSSTLETTLMGDMKCPGVRHLCDAQMGKKGLVTPDQGFGFRLSTMEKFSGGTGAPERTEISAHVQRLVSLIQGAIAGADVCSQLAHNFNIKTHSQSEAILSFVEQWHSELMMQCNCGTKEAWTFIGQCVRGMLDYLTPPRILVSHLQEWRSSANKAKIIWAMMQVHIRMDEIIAARFKSHPTITTVMSNFIMKTRVSESAVTDLAKKVKDVAGVSPKVAALEADVKFLKASLKKK